MDQDRDLELSVDREPVDEHTASISLSGPLDTDAVHRLSRTIMRLLRHAPDHRTIRLDLSQIAHCAPGSLFLLTGLTAVLDEMGIDLTITDLSTPVQATLDTEALEHRLPLHLT